MLPDEYWRLKIVTTRGKVYFSGLVNTMEKAIACKIPIEPQEVLLMGAIRETDRIAEVAGQFQYAREMVPERYRIRG